MSCRMITTVIKCQQSSILPLALFFSYLDVWGAATSEVTCGNCGFKSWGHLLSMTWPWTIARSWNNRCMKWPIQWHGPQSSRKHVIVLRYIEDFSKQDSTLETPKRNLCVLQFTQFRPSNPSNPSRPFRYRATQESKTQIQACIAPTAMHQDLCTRLHPKKADLRPHKCPPNFCNQSWGKSQIS